MKTYRIGTRGSTLALIQTELFVKALLDQNPELDGRLELAPIKTKGDTILDRKLIDFGGKSLFTKEIEQALLNKEIDFAVHSMKDVTVDVPEGLTFGALLEREDPRDVLISRENKPLDELPAGTRFGTSSLRRQAFILAHYPHFEVVPLRGNVQTRLDKLQRGDVDATLLAAAGLKRLNLMDRATSILPVSTFIPAIGQGAIGIQCRSDDIQALALLTPLNHMATLQAVTAERAFMKVLNGSCRTPIAAYAQIENERLTLKGMASDPEGTNMRFISHEGPVSSADAIGDEAGRRIREKS